VYAVLVRRALRVRVVLLKATQYALARHTLTLLVLAPVVALLAWVHANRQQPVATLFSSSTGQLLGAGVAFSLLLAAARERLLRLLDFFYSRGQLSHTQYLARCTRELPLA